MTRIPPALLLLCAAAIPLAALPMRPLQPDAHVEPAVAFAEGSTSRGWSEFFASLDVARLEAVDPTLASRWAAAVRAGDWDGAREAYGAWLRARARSNPPVLLRGGKPLAEGPSRRSDDRLEAGSTAERAMRLDVTVVGIAHAWDPSGPGGIDWGYDKTSEPGMTWNGNWLGQLTRMYWLLDQVDAWRSTGNPSTLIDPDPARWGAVETVLDFVADQPPPTIADIRRFHGTHPQGFFAFGSTREGYQAYQDAPYAPGSEPRLRTAAWSSLNVASRSGLQWPSAFVACALEEAVPAPLLADWARSFAEHARYLTNVAGSNNWIAIETGALHTIALLFPEFASSDAWRREAWARVAIELDRQVFPDGVQTEYAPTYHAATLRSFRDMLVHERAAGGEVPPRVLTTVHAMFRHQLLAADPQLRAVPLHDSDRFSIEASIREAAALFPDDPDLAWVARGKPAEGAPKAGALLFPDAGLAVWRSGWEPSARFALLDAGAYGTGHQHEDKLHLVLHHGGRQLLLDPARSSYAKDAHRDYMRTAAAHNTVLVDGLGQARRLADPALGLARARSDVVAANLGPLAWLAGSYGRQEGERFSDGERTVDFVHERHVVGLPTGHWLILDHLVPTEGDTTPRAITTHFQLDDGPERNVEGAVAVVHGLPRGGVRLSPHEGWNGTLALVRGREDPLLGWRYERRGQESLRIPIPTAVYAEAPAAGPRWNGWVVQPFGLRSDPAPGVLRLVASPAGLLSATLTVGDQVWTLELLPGVGTSEGARLAVIEPSGTRHEASAMPADSTLP